MRNSKEEIDQKVVQELEKLVSTYPESAVKEYIDATPSSELLWGEITIRVKNDLAFCAKGQDVIARALEETDRFLRWDGRDPKDVKYTPKCITLEVDPSVICLIKTAMHLQEDFLNDAMNALRGADVYFNPQLNKQL